LHYTANARQRKILWYQAIKSKLACCFKTEIHNYSFDTRKKIWNENVQQKFCQENLNLPFAIPGNVKLPINKKSIRRMFCLRARAMMRPTINEESDCLRKKVCGVSILKTKLSKHLYRYVEKHRSIRSNETYKYCSGKIFHLRE
jgi:hypothetical protein